MTSHAASGAATTETDAAEACRRLGLTLEETLPAGRPGPGVFVARVRDARGERLVLKRASPETGAHEVAALRVWSATGVTPRFVDEPEPGFYLVERLDGTSLHEVSDPPAAAVAVGRALRVLHGAAAPPAVCPDTRDQFAPDRRDWGSLPPELEEYRGGLATATGLPAPDGLCAGAGVADGLYVEPLALVDEMAGYGVLAYLQKNLAAGGSPAVARLEPLARELLRAGGQAAFVAECLS